MGSLIAWKLDDGWGRSKGLQGSKKLHEENFKDKMPTVEELIARHLGPVQKCLGLILGVEQSFEMCAASFKFHRLYCRCSLFSSATHPALVLCLWDMICVHAHCSDVELQLKLRRSNGLQEQWNRRRVNGSEQRDVRVSAHDTQDESLKKLTYAQVRSFFLQWFVMVNWSQHETRWNTQCNCIVPNNATYSSTKQYNVNRSAYKI